MEKRHKSFPKLGLGYFRKRSGSLRPGPPSSWLTWMVLPQPLQPLWGVHADIVLGVDDLPIQDGGGPATAAWGEGQEV